MNRQELVQQIKKKKSFLCIGLDSDVTKMPKGISSDANGIFEFNKQIIEATHDLCVAYKPNMAFYESLGSQGWVALEKTMKYLNENHPDIFTIADAKRGDIGNTSKLYARAFFEQMNFDSITVAPYMGSDSVKPFLESYNNKWVILLALTSNPGGRDFQIYTGDILDNLVPRTALYKKVIEVSKDWGNTNNMMYVVGATRGQMIEQVRRIIPDHFLLVPGVGAQGGSLQDVAKYGMNKDCGLLVNASRSIIYASNGEDFAAAARNEALSMQKEMEHILKNSAAIQ